MSTQTVTPPEVGHRNVPIDQLRPSKTNPRKVFDEEWIKNELAPSIKAHGVIEPLVTRPVNSHQEIVAGEQRWRAAKIAGLTEVPCIVRNLSDTQVLEIQLIVNLVRRDIHPIDEATALRSC